MNDTPEAPAADAVEPGWSARLIGWLAVLLLANVMVDTVVVAPLLVLPQMLEHYGTDQAAWLNASAMLAGAMWSPLLGRCADIYGKRRLLVITLLIGCAGSLVCLVAPNVGVFVVGRFLQGAAVAALFITVAFTREICSPGLGMTAVGIVTAGSSVLGIVSPFVLGLAISRFGFQSVFVTSAVLAAVAAVLVRCFTPRSRVTAAGRIDVVGAVLLGGGLAVVLTYASLGGDLGWLSGSMIALLAAGVAALAGWVLLALRVTDPIVDVRLLRGPIALTLLVVVLGAGSYQSVLQLVSLIAQVPPDLGLGYGLGGAEESVGMLFSAPALGVLVGGIGAGWVATRTGPERTLLGGVAVGTVATFLLLGAVSSLPVAMVCILLLGSAVGSIVTSGFNLAISAAPVGRTSTVSGLVTIMLAFGSVVLNVAGDSVLRATAAPVDGVPRNSLGGVYGYIVMAGTLFLVATVVAAVIVGRRRRVPMPVEVTSPSPA